MRYQKLLLIFSLLAAVLWATGYWKKNSHTAVKKDVSIGYYDQQKNDVKSEGFYKNAKDNGVDKKHYSNQKIAEGSFYKKSAADASYMKYYINSIFGQEALANDEKSGNRANLYYKNGMLQNEPYFKNDKKTGLEKANGKNANWVADIGSASDQEDGDLQIYKDLMRMLILRFSDKTMDDFHKNAKVRLGLSFNI